MQSSFSQETQNFFQDAWSSLMNPEKKTQHDNEINTGFTVPKDENACGSRPQNMDGKQNEESDTFWTLCPYCYYMYEYEKEYKECCLRCQNCQRAFQAVLVAARGPPPSVVVEGNDYYCGFGVFPLGYVAGDGYFGDKSVESGVCPGGSGVGSGEEKNVLEKEGVERSGKGHARVDEVEGVMQGRGQVEKQSAEKRQMKKVKSVAKCSKKIMGRGVRVGRIISAAALRAEGENVNVESQGGVGQNGDGIRAESTGCEDGNKGGSFEGEMQFFQGEEDIFIGLA